jgi:hypothetical protein
MLFVRRNLRARDGCEREVEKPFSVDGWLDAQCAQSLAVSRGDQTAVAGSEGVFVNHHVA